MESSSLSGRSILIAEDEPLIALDIAEAFKDAGATTVVTSTLHQALVLSEHDGLSGAVLDHALPDGDSSQLCQRLDERMLPFVVYSGLGNLHGACAKGAHIKKPEKPQSAGFYGRALNSGELSYRIGVVADASAIRCRAHQASSAAKALNRSRSVSRSPLATAAITRKARILRRPVEFGPRKAIAGS